MTQNPRHAAPQLRPLRPPFARRGRIGTTQRSAGAVCARNVGNEEGAAGLGEATRVLCCQLCL